MHHFKIETASSIYLVLLNSFLDIMALFSFWVFTSVSEIAAEIFNETATAGKFTFLERLIVLFTAKFD